jgi:hypothetical protein
MGIIFTGPGFLIYIVCGLWGTFICFQIIADNFGNIIAIISLIIAPALLGLAPWYAGISHGDWLPLALIYGGGILATALVTIGFKIDEK